MSPPFPLPDVEWEETAAFWSAARRGELVVPRCSGCQAYVWYPRQQCPSCSGAEMPWTPVSGAGTLFSWAVVRRAFLPAFAEQVPFPTGLVALAEDPSVRLVTTLVDCAFEDLRVDMPVRVVFRPLAFPGVEGEVVAPMFTVAT